MGKKLRKLRKLWRKNCSVQELTLIDDMVIQNIHVYEIIEFFITLSLPLMYVLNHCYTLTKRAHINSCQNEHTKDTSLSTFPEYILDVRLSIEISFWNRFWSDFWRFFSSFTWCLYSWKYYMAVKHKTITSLFVRKNWYNTKMTDDRWHYWIKDELVNAFLCDINHNLFH